MMHTTIYFDAMNKKNELTILTRLCQVNPKNIVHLKKVLKGYLNTCALSAIEVAQESGDPIGRVLSECLLESDNQILLNELFQRLPNHSIGLREVHMVLSERLLAEAQASEPLQLAHLMHSYAKALLDLGKRHKALLYAQESACLHQRKAYQDNHANHYRVLDSLFSFSECLMHVGNMDDALLVQNELVSILRSLYLSEPCKYQTYYIDSIFIISTYYRLVGDFHQSLNYCLKANRLMKRLYCDSPDHIYLSVRMQIHTARCYLNLGNIKKSSDILSGNMVKARDLCDRSYDRYILGLIDCLDAYSALLLLQGEKEQAHHYVSEGLLLLSDYYQQRPTAFSAEYASLLINAGSIYLANDDCDTALCRITEAITILESLFVEYPNRFFSDLIAAFNNRVKVYLLLRQYQNALFDIKSMLNWYREHGVACDANLAAIWHTLADVRVQQGDLFRAKRSAIKSIQIYRNIVNTKAVHLPDLAMVLATLALVLEHEEQYLEALQVVDEALAIWSKQNIHDIAPYAQAYSQVVKVRLSCLIGMEAYQEALIWSEHLLFFINRHQLIDKSVIADALFLQASLFDALGEPDKALRAIEQSIVALRELVEQGSESYCLDLAESIAQLAFMLSDDQPMLALVHMQEALSLFDRIPVGQLGCSVHNKVIVLQNLGQLAFSCDEYALAESTLTRAIALYSQLLTPFEPRISMSPQLAESQQNLLFCLHCLAQVHFRLASPLFIQTANALQARLNDSPLNIGDDCLKIKQGLTRLLSQYDSQNREFLETCHDHQ